MPDQPSRPAFTCIPDYELTNGDIAAQVGEDLGMPPDPDQREILNAIYAYRAENPQHPMAFDVGVIAPRQNIKTSTFEIAALTDLFVFQEPLHIWTAHLFKTAQQTFKHMVELVEGNRDYRRKCRKPRTANGDEAIVLLTGEEIQFHARSKGGGRGLTSPKVTLDEALFLSSLDMGALAPTLATMPNAQIRYGSSAGMIASDLLRALRDRGRAGADPSLAYFEWCAERRACELERCSHAVGVQGCALDDVELWAQANVALGRRITLETLANLRRAMPPNEFAREFLGWWEDPPVTKGGAFDLEAWLRLPDVHAEQSNEVVFGVDVGEDRMAHMAVAWRRPDGLVQVQLTDDFAFTPLQAITRLNELDRTWQRPFILGGPSALYEDDVRDSTVMTGSEFTMACGRFADLLRGEQLRHGNQPSLNRAIDEARWRKVGSAGERAIQLRDAPGVGPVAAAIRAVYGVVAGIKPPPAEPVNARSSTTARSETADLVTLQF